MDHVKVLHLSHRTIDSSLDHMKVLYLSYRTIDSSADHRKVRYILCEALHGSMCHRKVWYILYGTIERIVYWTSVSTTHSPFCFGGCCHIYTHQIRLKNLYHLSGEFLKCRQRYVISWSKGSVHFVRNPSWVDESSEGSAHFVRNPTRFHGSSKSLV